MGKVPVNLNYTLSPEVMEKALKKANISQVITSEKFLDKLNAKGFDFSQVVADKALFMENLGKSITKANKVRSFLTALFLRKDYLLGKYLTGSTDLPL